MRTIDDTAESVARARASLAEITAREAADAAREAAESGLRELARWNHEADSAAETAVDDGEDLSRKL